MEGFLQLLVIAFVIWAWARGGKRRVKRPPPPPPPGDTSSSDEGQEINWDEAIGEVLEGFGLPRPERPRPQPERPLPQPERSLPQPERSLPEPGAEARRLPLPEVADGEAPARDRTVLEIAGLAEAAARRRRELGRAIEPGAAPGRAGTLPTTVESPVAPEPSARPSPRRLAGGLAKLEQLSELERAVVYAEILGRPKAFGDQDEPLA